MPRALNMIIVLVIIGVISGSVLAIVYNYSKPLITKHQLEALKAAIFTVLPETDSYHELRTDELVIYQGVDSEGNPVGSAFVVEGSGYQGIIKIMVGINNELTQLTGIKVLENVETPGLGAKIAEERRTADGTIVRPFEDQFKGILIDPEIVYVKGKKPEKPNEIQAITGATVSSRAVVNIINQYLDKVRNALREE